MKAGIIFASVTQENFLPAFDLITCLPEFHGRSMGWKGYSGRGIKEAFICGNSSPMQKGAVVIMAGNFQKSISETHPHSPPSHGYARPYRHCFIVLKTACSVRTAVICKSENLHPDNIISVAKKRKDK